MEQIANELKDVFIPFSQGQRQQFIAEFESKTGISLPTDEQLEKVIGETLNADEGKWRKTIPEEIISLFEKRPDEILDSGALFSLRKKVVAFCYEQSKSYSSLTIARLFGLCVLKTVLIWSKKDYIVTISTRREAEYHEFMKDKKVDNPDWDFYSTMLDWSKMIYNMVREPLEIIGKAYFGEQDIEWHNSELSTLSINAAIRVVIETQQGESDLVDLLSNKYYNLMRGSRGASTPARTEYQRMMFKSFGLERYLEGKSL